MICGEKVEVEVSWYEWCWKLFVVPWRCKKTAIKTRYMYEFKPTRPKLSLFKKSYEGCCGAKLYKFSDGFSFFGTGNGAWDHITVRTKYFKNQKSPIDDCPFNNDTADIPEVIK